MEQQGSEGFRDRFEFDILLRLKFYKLNNLLR